MKSQRPHEAVQHAYHNARDQLCAALGDDGHWTGSLSTSALSTATAVMAFEQVARQDSVRRQQFTELIRDGIAWLARHQNADGGWGDTTLSRSNISTTMLAHAVFHATNSATQYPEVVQHANSYIERHGGVESVLRRYGKDRTFSIPILTHCALAGTCSWKQVIALPFEFACLPARFYKTVRLPVVSYALPALIAIGQAIHVHRPSRNPLTRFIRERARAISLRVLERIQPTNGGFLEATPLTSFVTMSLASIGLIDHPVVRRGLEFLEASVRDDGSWPIDTNLATWVSTLSVNALQQDVPEAVRQDLVRWLLDQQYRTVHPYTNADPGGWAWTNLPGGVPDADDTPGAVLALLQLADSVPEQRASIDESVDAAVDWLLGLQNGNGGWPTFCRGWGALPFDRSSCDITAHVLRACDRWLHERGSEQPAKARRVERAIRSGFAYLCRQQRPDGSWLPLWFGNQYLETEENPVYGTSRVLLAFEALGRGSSREARRAVEFLEEAQNPDGGWGGGAGTRSSVEETSLALEALLASGRSSPTIHYGLNWLVDRVASGRVAEPSPIGFYFAKLWYFEELYPLIYACSALRKATGLSSTMADESASDSVELVRSTRSLDRE